MWAAEVAGSEVAHPDYIMDLITFDAPRSHIYEALGFSPGRTFSAHECDAIQGLAYLRNRLAFEAPNRDRALQALQQNPSVGAEFAAIFTFIQPDY